MIHWSTCSDLIKYIDRSLDMTPSLTVKPLDYRQHIDCIIVWKQVKV